MEGSEAATDVLVAALAAFEGRALATLIAAILTAVGGILLWFLNRRYERVEAARLRDERSADMQRALAAEIRTHIHQLDPEGLEEAAAWMLQRIGQPETPDEGGARFVPLIPRERHDTIFQAMVADIALLTADVIGPVVRYDSQLHTIADFADDMRGARFTAIAPERQRQMYRHFIELKHTARRFGEDAVAILDWSLRRGGAPPRVQ
ncbi:MAG: hypothetical protein AAF677_18090 [Pseudomonadota bacterium]